MKLILVTMQFLLSIFVVETVFAENSNCPSHYPDGETLRVSNSYLKGGDLIYPNGQELYLSSYYLNHRQMYYPNGNTLRVGERFLERETIYYPNGQELYLSSYYLNHRQMYYPNGNTLRAGESRIDKGRLRFIDGGRAGGNILYEQIVDANTVLKVFATKDSERFVLEIKQDSYSVDFEFGVSGEVFCRVYQTQ